MRENGVMLETGLVGYWSDKHLYPGDMEATDIAFCADGTGWTDWTNAAQAFEIMRFRWQASGSTLVLHLHEYVSGTWNLDGGTAPRQQRDRHALDEQIPLGYEITEGQNAVGGPATVLQFDRHVILGVSSNRFAFERELADGERDPAYSSAVPPGVT